jgi:SPX domain protein involved in polyphosphate accumulation
VETLISPRWSVISVSCRVFLRSPQEAAFFKLVNKELQKMTQFFCSVEAQMLGRLGHVREGMKLIDMDTVLGKDEASWRHLLAACIKLYKDLLRLENYAIVAWTSVSKILKKHDKWTGKL